MLARFTARSRRGTARTLAGIAERLRMAAPGHVVCLLYRGQEAEVESENKLF